MKQLPVIILAISYFTNQFLLGLIYPERNTDYEVFNAYYNARMCLYEFVFFIAFTSFFIHIKGNVRYLALFTSIMALGSVADKIIFMKNEYLITDIALFFFAIALTYYVKNKSGGS